MLTRARNRIYEILEVPNSSDRFGKVDDIFLTSLIVINIIAVMLESIEGLSDNTRMVLRNIDVISSIIFTIEYVLRIWSCTASKKFKHPILGRIRFALQPMMIVDLLAILPFYLPMFISFDLRGLRAIRLFRLIRIFKFHRYSESMQIFTKVMRKKSGELATVFFVVIILLIMASTLMYVIESEAQPDVFASIPSAMWWSVITMTTVGYGDAYPVTIAGKFLASIIAVFGIGLFALPAGVLGSGFIEEVQNKKTKPKRCPHCGKEIEE